MSINQDELAELASATGQTPEELQNAGSEFDPLMGASKVPTTFTANLDHPQQEDPLTPELRAKLLDPSAKFKLIKDGVESVTSMGDIHEEVAAGVGISSNIADRVATRFEGFSKVFHPASFTSSPTKVNYHGSLGYMANALKLRKEEISADFALYFSETMSESEEGFKQCRDFYSEEITQALTDLAVRFAKWNEDPNAAFKQQVMYTDREANVAKVPITFFEELTLHPNFNSERYSLFAAAVKDFATMDLKNELLSTFVWAIAEVKSIEEMVNFVGCVYDYNHRITPLKILEVVASPGLLTFMQKFEKAVEDSIKLMYETEAEAKVDRSNFEDVRKFVLKNGDTIDTNTRYTECYLGVMDIVRRLIPIANAILTYFEAEK